MSNSPIVFHPLPTRSVLTWYADAFAIWWRAPAKLSLLAILPLLAEGLLQLIPDVGIVLSKFVVPILTFGLATGVYDLARGSPLRAACMVAGFRREWFPRCAVLALWTMSVFASQLLIAFFAYGPGVIDAVVAGHIAAHPEFQTRMFSLVLILPGVALATLLMLSAPWMLFGGASPTRAVFLSARRILSAPLPFAVILSATALVLFVALATTWGFVVLLAYFAVTAGLNVAVWNAGAAEAPAGVTQPVTARE